MFKYLHKLFLRVELSFFKKVFFLHTLVRRIYGLLILIKEFSISSAKFLSGLNRSYKFLFVCIVGLLFFSAGIVVRAQTITPSVDPSDPYSSNTPQLQTYSANVVQDEFMSMLTIGNNVVRGTTDAQGNQTLGMIPLVNNLDAYVYENNPVSFVQYATYYAQAHNLVPSTYAQTTAASDTGTGYSSLSPIIPLWEIVRNIAYLMIAVMIVVIGFIIIFGGKYGQTEVTIISSIPKIIIALILITFSYPIAGFAIDLSNLGTNVIVNLLGPRFVQSGYYYPGQYPVGCGTTLVVPSNAGEIDGTQPGSDQQIDACDYFTSFGVNLGAGSGGTAQGQGGIAKGLGGDFNIFRLMSPIINYQNWNPVAKGSDSILDLIQTPTDIGFLDAFLYGIPFNVGSDTAILVITFIMNVLMLFWAIKIFILILTSFIRIVTSAMLGPFVLLSYPLNGNDALWNFLKSLLAPALVFPVVFAMLFVAAILAYGTDCYSSSTGASAACAEQSNYSAGPWYINPNSGLTNFDSGPLLFVDTINPNFIWNFVALGIIIAIPGIGKQIDELLKTEISRHLEGQTRDAGQRAAKIASRIPFIGGVLGQIM